MSEELPAGLEESTPATTAVNPPPSTPGAIEAPKTAPAPVRKRNSANEVAFSLDGIFRSLPIELKGRVRYPEDGNVAIALPLEKILPQLSQGSVKISFGELREAGTHMFSGESDCDHMIVSLPLNEILSQINPDLLTRRTNQKQIEVPEEVSGPFGLNGNGVTFATELLKPGPSAQRNPVPGTLPLPVFTAPKRTSIQSTPPPTPPGAPPASNGSNNYIGLLIAAPAALRNLSNPGSAPSTPSPAPRPNPTENKTPSLTVPLSALAVTWADSIRQEIVQLNLSAAQVALPIETVEMALKQGKLAFPWRTIRSWIKPSPLPSVSAHDAAVLDLPLHVVTPLFMAGKQKSPPQRRRIKVDENIPNLFFGFPQPDAAPVETPRTVAPPAHPQTNGHNIAFDAPTKENGIFKGKPLTGTEFVTRYATPNEIVSRAASLDGVAGALIALPDGLMVSSRIPPELNGDTLAAFVPQIFARVSQCAKELRMGELNHLNFMVGNIPWSIIRINAVYLAAFGHAGEALPTGQLVALAAELDRKNK